MTIEISVSQESRNFNKTFINTSGCNHIIESFIKANIEGKFTPNISIFNKYIELGCTITLNKNYNSKKQILNIWEIIKNSPKYNSNLKENYTCAHLKIDGEFNGCILNYLNHDSCPYEK